MADIADLLVRVRMDASRFNRELQQINRDSASIGETIGRSLRLGILAGVAAFATLTVASAAFFSSFKDEASRATEILNKAFSLNVSTDELQAFQYAAQTIGISSEKTADILKDVNDKMGDLVTTGGGELKDVFETLNLSIDDFVDKNPVEVIEGINEALQGASTQQKAFVFESLANDASLLLPILKDGENGLDDLMQKAIDLGYVISNQDLTSYKEFNSQVTQLSTQFGSLKTIIFASLSEPLAQAATYFNELVQEFGGFQEMGSSIANGIVDGIVFAARVVENLYTAFLYVQGVIEAIQNGLTLVAALIVRAVKTIVDTIPFLDKALGAFGSNFSKSINLASDDLDGMVSKARTISEIQKDIDTKSANWTARTDGLVTALETGRAISNNRRDGVGFQGDTTATGGEANTATKARYEETKLKNEQEKLDKEAERLLKENQELAKQRAKYIDDERKEQTKFASSLNDTAERFKSGADKLTEASNKPMSRHDANVAKWEAIRAEERASSMVGYYSNAGTTSNLSNVLPSNHPSQMGNDVIGTINLNVANEQGIVKMFSLLGSVKTLKDLGDFVRGGVDTMINNGAMAQS